MLLLETLKTTGSREIRRERENRRVIERDNHRDYIVTIYRTSLYMGYMDRSMTDKTCIQIREGNLVNVTHKRHA